MARMEDAFLTQIIIDIINRRDFIDYGILVSHTQVFFDEEYFEVVIVSPYYFKYVQRHGARLLDDFLNDTRFMQFINFMYQEITKKRFDRIMIGDGFFDLIPIEPEIVLVETMTPDSVKSMTKNMESRRKLYGRSTYY